MADLSDFERRQITGAHLSAASVTKTATLLRVLRATVSKIMLAYTIHGKTTSGKRNSGQKSTMTERNHCTSRKTVQKITELLQHK
jgi:IS30 family transposase